MSNKKNGIGTIAFAYFKEEISRNNAINYWRGNHGWLVSQQEGCSIYRQVKFSDNPVMKIPNWTVDMNLSERFIPDGAAENLVPTYLRGAKVMLSDNKKKIYLDERNFLRQVFMYTTLKKNCVYYRDDLYNFDDESGVAEGERILLLFKGDNLKEIVMNILPNLALKNKDIKEIHSYYFAKYRENLWASFDVNHSQPKSAQYSAALLLGADNKQTVLDFLYKNDVSKIINESTAEAVYALDVEKVTIMRYNDCRSKKAINGKA